MRNEPMLTGDGQDSFGHAAVGAAVMGGGWVCGLQLTSVVPWPHISAAVSMVSPEPK